MIYRAGHSDEYHKVLKDFGDRYEGQIPKKLTKYSNYKKQAMTKII